MKHLLLITLVFALASCGNKKAKLVDQIKVYNDSLNTIGREKLALNQYRDSVAQKYTDSVKIDFNTKDLKALTALNEKNVAIAIRKENAIIDIEKSQMPKRHQLQIKEMVIKTKIDSLELELKKY